MPRLIDANALETRMGNLCDEFGTDHLFIDAIIYEIGTAPTVEAVEVVHGRWELHGNDDDCGCSYFCSNCHESYEEDWFYVHGQYRHLNYCPNCGAKMDGDGNG